MELATQCPHCKTTFTVTPAQLQLRKGYVRCPHCASIFDGYEAVVGSESKIAPAVPAPVQQAPITAVSRPQEVEPPRIPQVLRERPARTPAHIISDLQSGQTDQAGSLEGFSISSSTAPTESDPEPGLYSLPSFTSDEPHITDDASPLPHDAQAEPSFYGEGIDTFPRAMPREESVYHNWSSSLSRLFWFVLIVIGLLALLAQLLFVYRVQIAEAVPNYRPVLERLCTYVHCDLPYSRRPELIHITKSSLQFDKVDDASDNTRFILAISLRNDFKKPQEWPTLILELTDAAGAKIARRHLAPNNYLPAKLQNQPFDAASEVSFRLPLVMQGLQVNGYHLTTFFP